MLSARPRSARGRSAVVLATVLVLSATAGCGFLDAMARPEAQHAADESAPAGGTPAGPPPVPAPTTPADRYPAVVAEGALAAVDGGRGTSITVTVGHVQTGLVLPFIEFATDCPVEGPGMQYVPVSFDYDLTAEQGGGLAGHLTVTPGPDTPGDIGDVGVFFEPTTTDPYCADHPPLPTTDTFWGIGTQHVDGYVVLDRAVTAATPEGRDDVFPTLQARISDLRVRDAAGRERPLTVGQLSAGSACADDEAAICVPLG